MVPAKATGRMVVPCSIGYCCPTFDSVPCLTALFSTKGQQVAVVIEGNGIKKEELRLLEKLR